MALEVTILTSGERCLSQWWEKMSVFRTSGLAESTQMKRAHVSNPGATWCWGAHKKPSLTVLFQARPPCCPSVGKMLRNGSDPQRWFAEWLKELSVEWKDRAWHEMHTLMDIFHQAGCYDQLNMGALACMELVNRRLQQYTEACAHGADAPNSASAKHFLRQQLLSRPGAPRRCDRVRVVSAVRVPNSKIYVRDQRHTQPTLAWRPRLPQLWSEVFLEVQFVAVAPTKTLAILMV